MAEQEKNALQTVVESVTGFLTVKVHPAGWPFIAAFAIAAVLLALAADFLGFMGLVLTIWCLYFFRDPVRMVPDKKGFVISSADGRVSHITEKVCLPKELKKADNDKEEYTRVSTFLSVFDVHVNRIPIAGKIKEIAYIPGKFMNAELDKASDDNERSVTLIETEDKTEVAFVQIAGLIARRIKNNIKEDQDMKTGERMGIIRFGSRVDIYLPKGVAPQVVVGQRVVGGETVIGDLTSKEKARTSVPE